MLINPYFAAPPPSTPPSTTLLPATPLLAFSRDEREESQPLQVWKEDHNSEAWILLPEMYDENENDGDVLLWIKQFCPWKNHNGEN
jgi:hypothetical protein